MDLAHGVRDVGHAVGTMPAGPRVLQRLPHAVEGPSRVRGQEDVVQQHEDVEGPGLAHGPRLVVALLIHAVHIIDSSDVDDGRGQGIDDRQ